MITMKYTALITIAALVYTFILSGRVGARRAKLGVNAPAMSGQPEFDIAFRVHMNTIEQLVLFVPMLWIAVTVVGDVWAAAIGAVWIVGRIILYGGIHARCGQARAGHDRNGAVYGCPDRNLTLGSRAGLHGLI